MVSVASGSLVAVIAGSEASRSVRVGSSITVDGSESYDQNIKNAFGASIGLTYSWSCIQTKPTLNQTCVNIFERSSLEKQQSAEKLLLSPVINTQGFEATITMIVTDVTKSRSASTAVTIAVLSALSAEISIQSSASSNLLNPGQSLQLSGMVKLPSEISSAMLLWSTNGRSGLNMSSIALTPAVRSITVGTSISSNGWFPFVIKLATTSFRGGLTYSFSLLCQLPSPGVSTVSTISIKANSPPTPGEFVVSPAEGIELSDPFTFSCQHWLDDNLPIQYSFGYITTSGSKSLITSPSETAFKSTQLPGGLNNNGYQVTCVVDITDSFAAKSTAVSNIIVKVQDLSTEKVNSFLNQTSSVFSSSNVDSVKQAAGVMSYLLNKVNCSLAPNCSSLNRYPCGTTAQTCGPCLASNYIGQIGDSNDKCFTSIQDLKLSSSSTPKQCGGGCSGHGTCEYHALSGAVVKDCLENDFSCSAVCVCDVGFQASSICDLSDEQIATKMSYRETLIGGLMNLMNLQDPSENGLTNIISSLSDATQSASELSFLGVDLVVNLADQIILSASTVDSFTSDNLLGIFNSLDSASSAVIQIGKRRRRYLSTEERTEDSVIAIQSSVHRTINYIALSMLPGEEPIELIMNNIRSLMKAADLEEDPSKCEDGVSVGLPQTNYEKAMGFGQSAMKIPSCRKDSSTSSVSIGLASLSNAMYGNSFDSDSLSLSLSSIRVHQLRIVRLKLQ
jgi:hypothetical protein